MKTGFKTVLLLSAIFLAFASIHSVSAGGGEGGEDNINPKYTIGSALHWVCVQIGFCVDDPEQ